MKSHIALIVVVLLPFLVAGTKGSKKAHTPQQPKYSEEVRYHQNFSGDWSVSSLSLHLDQRRLSLNLYNEKKQLRYEFWTNLSQQDLLSQVVAVQIETKTIVSKGGDIEVQYVMSFFAEEHHFLMKVIRTKFFPSPPKLSQEPELELESEPSDFFYFEPLFGVVLFYLAVNLFTHYKRGEVLMPIS